MKNPLCSLCQGRGCVTHLLGRKTPPSSCEKIPVLICLIIYGTPLLFLLVGGVLGAWFSDDLSILGAGLGLIFSYLLLKACQSRLNILSLRAFKESGEDQS